MALLSETLLSKTQFKMITQYSWVAGNDNQSKWNRFKPHFQIWKHLQQWTNTNRKWQLMKVFIMKILYQITLKLFWKGTWCLFLFPHKFKVPYSGINFSQERTVNKILSMKFSLPKYKWWDQKKRRKKTKNIGMIFQLSENNLHQL